MQETQETRVQSLGREDPLEKEMAPTLVFLPGKRYGQRSLAGCSPWGHSEALGTLLPRVVSTLVAGDPRLVVPFLFFTETLCRRSFMPRPHPPPIPWPRRALLLRGQERPEGPPLSPRPRAPACGGPLSCGMGRAGDL